MHRLLILTLLFSTGCAATIQRVAEGIQEIRCEQESCDD